MKKLEQRRQRKQTKLTLTVDKLRQVISRRSWEQTMNFYRPILQEQFMHIFMLFIFWPPGMTDTFKVNSLLSHRQILFWVLLTIMWKINCTQFVGFFLPCWTTQTCCRYKAEALVFTEWTPFFFSWHANMLGQRAVWVTVNGISQAVLKVP